MKVEENIFLANLYDAYGPLLSEGQRRVIESYLMDDLTVTEIAQNLNISRQAVMDGITKAEKKLYAYEKKLNFVSKMKALEEENKNLKKST